MTLRIAALACALLGFTAGAAQAAGLSVSPVMLDLSAKRPITAVTVGNQDAMEKVIQAEVQLWRRENGKDILESSEDLTVSPPMFRVASGKKQVVRVGLTGDDAPSDAERTYRLILQELPQPGDETTPGQLRMLLRMSMPIFIAPAGKHPQTLETQLLTAADGKLQLKIANRGRLHARILKMSLQPVSGEALDIDEPAYVFPGEERVWTVALPANWQGPTVTLTATTDHEPYETSLPFQR